MRIRYTALRKYGSTEFVVAQLYGVVTPAPYADVVQLGSRDWASNMDLTRLGSLLATCVILLLLGEYVM